MERSMDNYLAILNWLSGHNEEIYLEILLENYLATVLELVIREQGENIHGEITRQLPGHRVGTGYRYTRRKYTWRVHWTITWPPCWNWLSGHKEEIYLERSLDKASQPKKKCPQFNNDYFFQFSPYFQFFKIPVLIHISSFYTKVK